jgi:nucleotide-binding universal stress UspA family protein
MAPVSVETVLAPVDGSDEASTAIEYAVAVADRYDATVHALYILDESVVRDIERGEMDETAAAVDSQAALDEYRECATAADVPFVDSTVAGFSTRRKMTHPGSVVLDIAEDVGADFIVVPREPVAPEDTLTKAAEYVIAYATPPVLSV